MPSILNVASHLARMAAEHPAQVALLAPRGRVKLDGPTDHHAITFAELNASADALAHGLHAAGITRGTRTALMVPPSADFFTLAFALFKVGAIPVLIDPGMGIKNLGRCLADAEPEASIAVPRAHAARLVLGWGKRTIRTTATTGRWRFFCDTTVAHLYQVGRTLGSYSTPEPGPAESAAILFTSGSTGIAKGVLYTHDIFAAQIDLLKQTYRIEPGEIDLCTFPLFALFGPALGMTCVIPDMDASRPARLNPRKAAMQIRQFGVTNMFGSPAVIRRLGELDAPLASLRRVISAGAPASPAALERFIRLLPSGAEVFTPYGATEALPVANISSFEILGETRQLTEQGQGVCVGLPVAGVEIRVIHISDEPIAEWDDSLLVPSGEVGEFVVRGPVVTRQYYNRPDATRGAKIRDSITGELYHRMGDVGYLDDRGRLWFCGRKTHRIVTPQGTLFTDMVEPIFNTVAGVARTALVGVKRNGVTYPVLCFEQTSYLHSPGSRVNLVRRSSGELEASLRAVGARHDHTRGIDTFIKYPGLFPVDVRHNSKIFREKLAVWADRKLGPKWNPAITVEARA